MSDPYKVLGVPDNSTDDEIKKARRKLLFDLHSDRLPKDLPEGAARLINEKVLEINDAFNEIMRRRASKSSNPPPSRTGSQARDNQGNYSSEGSQNTNPDSSAKQSAGESDQAAQSTPSTNKEKTTLGGQFVNLLGKVAGALIGVALMQTCRSLIANRGASENARQKAEDIIYSDTNYCPELAENIRQKNYSGEEQELKLLREMLRSSPEGSKYRQQVNIVITKILNNGEEDRGSLRDSANILFKNYMPIICNGDLLAAKIEADGNSETKGVTEEFSKTQLTYAKAICAAIKSNAAMGTTEELRSVGAVYMGREMDLLGNDEKMHMMKEVASNMDNSKWINQAMIAVVKQCPEDAYKMAEE